MTGELNGVSYLVFLCQKKRAIGVRVRRARSWRITQIISASGGITKSSKEAWTDAASD